MADTKKVIFKGINSKSWEHPADRAAMASLKATPMIETVVQKVMGFTSDRAFRLIALGSMVRVSDKQFPKVHRLVQEASEILDIQPAPECYVNQNPFFNAFAAGAERPFISLNSSIVNTLEDKELLGIIGHELGHLKSGHVPYKNLLRVLTYLSSMFFGVSELVMMAIITALREWDRKSELSCDRAALLVLQESEPYMNCLMKMAGGSNIGEMNLNEFYQQAADYESSGDALDGVYKILNLMGQTHPFPVIRLKELKAWELGGEYKKIIDGEYSTEKEKGEDIFKSFKNAGDSYKADVTDSKDPLAEKLKGFGADLEKAGKEFESKAKDFFDGLFK